MSPPLIPGLFYRPEYLLETNEKALIDAVDARPWLTDLRRRVQHYGYRYDYKTRRIGAESALGPLPGFLSSLARQLFDEGYYEYPPDQVIINEYRPGQGIASHIDRTDSFGPIISIISLGSACAMKFDHVVTGMSDTLHIEPRSLIVLQDEARYEWRHGIGARKNDVVNRRQLERQRRISLTFRTAIKD